MPAQAIPSTSAVGSVAAAATTGALVAIGRRAGGAGFPFAAMSSVILRRTPSADDALLVVSGVALHVALTLAWTALFLRLTRRPGSNDLVTAGSIAVAQFALSWIVAWISGTGLASVLSLGDRVAFAVVMAGGLVAGMRFARLTLRIA